MNITRAKEFVLDTVRAYLAVDDDGMRLIDPALQRPLFLVGPPGIGKTAIMAQVARELEVGLISYSMTHHTRQSALGLPVVEHQEYRGFEYDASEYTMSEIIASIYDYMRASGREQGILFLDEVNCVSETLYPSMLQFLQFKTFGKHAVPAGWVIVCAGNPPEYNRSVHEFDVVTLDRIRRIEVEPDFNAWKVFAADAAVHPAVTTFLEAERDCFYRIESTPGGKRFVTARSWDDLSRMIALNESLGLAVDRELIEQFVQDADIAEQFSLYYDLFRKYQSDYEIPRILAGEASDEVRERAGGAQLDERMALLGLLLDALAPEAADIQLREETLTDVRDALRAVKEGVLGGGSMREALAQAIAERERAAERIAASNVRDESALRRALRSASMLKGYQAACVRNRVDAGNEAFLLVHQEFRGHAGAFEADVSAYRQRLENAYAFLEGAFGDGNELLLFTTEVTARRATAHFVSRYGCDAFSRGSRDMQTTERRRDLLGRIEATVGAAEGDTPTGNSAAGNSAPTGGSVSTDGAPIGGVLTGGSASAGNSASADDIPTSGSVSVGGSAPTGGVPAGGVPTSTSPDTFTTYYEHAQWEFGYASLCHMALPAGLEGKTVLDVGCRRGKGVFKLSDRVGAGGHAIGVDWVADHIDEATSRMDRAARETGLPANNMEFHLAYPEDLLAAGIGDSTIDVAFVNSVLHLTCDPEQVVRELHRVLKPSGLLILEIALASGPRDAAVVEAARALGNSIQAAPARSEFERLLAEIGFTVEVVEGPNPVEANMGFKRGHEAPVAPSTEAVTFNALVLHAVKHVA